MVEHRVAQLIVGFSWARPGSSSVSDGRAAAHRVPGGPFAGILASASNRGKRFQDNPIGQCCGDVRSELRAVASHATDSSFARGPTGGRRLGVEAETQSVQRPQPEVAPSAIRVGASDAAPCHLDP